MGKKNKKPKRLARKCASTDCVRITMHEHCERCQVKALIQRAMAPEPQR